jgi:Ser/Thr protein kinase RdoA (MazF antagonist)
MTVPKEILAQYNLTGARIAFVAIGNLNTTYRVNDQYILQKLNPVFTPDIHFDIDAITAHLENQGILTPRLVKTTEQALWAVDELGGIWRLMNLIPGQTFLELSDTFMCFAAGKFLGQFHRALTNFNYTFVSQRRPDIHNTAKHLEYLKQVLQTHQQHRAHAEVRRIADQIFVSTSTLNIPRDLPLRLVHGDPKVSNFIFTTTGEACALVDLDTLNHMTLAVELGDALRSWCNPQGEDSEHCVFNWEFFEHSLRGYGQAFTPNQDEIESIPQAVEMITLELSARFAADALAETYFGWDKTRFANASDHHLRRAQAMLKLAQSYDRNKAAQIVGQVFT